MSKYLRTLLAILCAAIASASSAQIYVIDDNFVDSVEVCHIKKNATNESLGSTAFKLPLGETVMVERLLNGQSSYCAVKIDGKEYGMSGWYLLMSDENPEGTEDILGDTRSRVNHSLLGKFFATMTPYWIVAILLVISMAFTWLGLKNEKIREIALIEVPSSLLAVSVIEAMAYWTLGTTAFWWCDPDKFGFFGALFRVIPFILFVAFQLYSIKLYMHLLTNDEDNELSVKPMLISIGLCIPVTLAVVFCCAGFFGIKSPWLEIITVVTFLLSLGIGIFISTKKNLEELGKTAGTMFTLFGIVWAIGAVVALVGLVIVIFKLILQILIVIAACFGLAFAFGQGDSDSSGSGGNSGGTQSYWIDAEGGRHTSQFAAEESNKRIAERKANS